MSDHTPTHPPAQNSQPHQAPADGYDPPQIEDLPAPEGSAVTAAGAPTRG